MKILIEGDPARYDRYSPHLEIQKTAEVVFVPRGADQETMLKNGWDAEVLFVDAISRVDGDLIRTDVPVREIYAGCICCSLSADFRNGIREIAEQTGIPEKTIYTRMDRLKKKIKKILKE